MMFTVGYGSANREQRIKDMAKTDHTTAVILAAVHFEWMIKRSILKLGVSPTKDLRKELASVFTLKTTRSAVLDYQKIWDREIAKCLKRAKLGIVLGNLHTIQSKALDVRGRVIHGNGVVSKDAGGTAIEAFLGAAQKLRDFAKKHGEDLDTRLRARINRRRMP